MAHPLLAPGFTTRPWWWEAAEPPQRDASLPDHAPIAIVGGGYAGLSAALTLQRLGRQAVVLDAERIGWGASSRNGGMVSGGLKVAGTGLEKSFGKDQARAITGAAAASFPFIEETIAREGIDCDYVRCGRYAAAWSRGHYDAMARRAEGLAEITGLPVTMLPKERQREALGSDHYHGGMLVAATGSLHPGKYARGLAAAAERAGARLVDGVRVQGIREQGSGFRVATDKGELRADAVLVTTNGYSLDQRGTALPWLARRLVPLNSYIIATEELGEDVIERLFPGRRMVADSKRVLNYFRPSPDGKRVLWGGRASFRAATAEDTAPALHAYMTACFPELKDTRITHAWTGHVAFTFDHLPHIGVERGIHYAAGCQGSGVAMATWLGHNVALKLAGAANARFALDGLPFPTRPFYSGNPNWVLPFIGEWYKLRDRIDRLAA
ncbi:NAD(P)/FAD-dependent oxidoreductase [Paracraurococcus ruber]|uniref:FAD-dependent oxidoreductase n=1 Tax=Paracraurococcus ruber TaxID=77675 RepID=A0ABS1CX00_9PROT|nr:FAD-binding oxidoreductase [Paracraurococcus ruber]MBK1658264.1 FAD-dependent oxidoreductase [Paracraurococcus ruber]TDG30725.1 FAD-binding oxidoreductase [Paracraurococcus ruber]